MSNKKWGESQNTRNSVNKICPENGKDTQLR